MADATLVAAIDSRGAQLGAQQFSAAIGTMNRAAAGLSPVISIVASAVAALAGAFSVREIISAGDAYQNMISRLNLFAKAGQSAEGILSGLNESAARAKAPVSAIADIYNRNAGALQNLGKTEAEGIRLAETLYKAMVVSGGATQAGKEALFQFSQSLASGQFRGQEFNSVAEQAPEIIRIIGRETGKTTGELRNLANAGQLTAEVAFEALLRGSKKLDEQFTTMPITVSQAWDVMSGSFSQAIGAAVKGEGATKAFADAILEWGKTLNSDDVKGGLDWMASRLKDFAEFAGSAARELRLMRIEAQLAADAAGKQDPGVLSNVWTATKSVLGNAFGAIGAIGRGVLTGVPGGQEGADFRAQAEQLDAWQTGTRVLGPDAVSAVDTDPNKPFAAKFGGAKEKTADEIAKIRAEAQKLLDISKLQDSQTQAQINGDTGLVGVLKTEQEIRQRISDDVRKYAPEKAAAIEEEIRRQNALEIQLKEVQKVQERNAEFAQEFSSTIVDGFNSAIKGGKSFTDTLREVAANLIEVIAKAALLKPLQDQIGQSITGALKNSGSDVGGLGSIFGSLFGNAGSAAGAGIGGWATSVTPFADGGVINGPTRFAAGGINGLAGEAGPEAILPLRRGADGTLGVASSGGATRGGDVYITIAGDATDATVEKMRRVAAEIVASSTPGIVNRSVAKVRQTHLGDPRYLNR